MRFYKNGPDGMPYYEAKPQNWYRFVKNDNKVFGCYAPNKGEAWILFREAMNMTPEFAGVTCQEYAAPTI